MRNFLKMFMMVALTGCTTAGHRTVSAWYPLEKASSVRCGPWPMREKDLQVDDVTLVRGHGSGGRGFLVSGLKRDASPLHYYADFKDDPQVDADTPTGMSLGRGAVVIGGEDAGGGRLLANVMHNYSEPAAGGRTNDKVILEVRGIKDNLVKGKMELGAFNVVEGATVPGQGGAWLLYKSEDNIYHVAFLDLRAKDGKPVTRPLTGATFADRPIILPAATRSGALLLWKEGEVGRPFKARMLGTDGSMGPVLPLPLAVTSQVESWSAVTYGGGYYLAMIDGDSMIGQASLRISFVNWTEAGPALRWTNGPVMRDVHATEPVFLVSSRGLEVMMVNWIDEESTIARYMVAGGNVGKPAYSGLFQKGTRIVDAFTGESPDDAYVVTRHRDGERWVFQVCEI